MKLFFYIFCFISFSLNAQTLHSYKVIRVIDGDTIVFDAQFLPDPLKKEMALRIHGLDTPEKGPRAKCTREEILGKKATEFTTRKINRATRVQFSLHSWDKFGGRVLGDIYLDGQSLKTMLLTEGLAREYSGEKKRSWCD